MPCNTARLRVMNFNSGQWSYLSPLNIEEATPVSRYFSASFWINLT